MWFQDIFSLVRFLSYFVFFRIWCRSGVCCELWTHSTFLCVYRKQKYLFFVEWFRYFPLLYWDLIKPYTKTGFFLTLILWYRELCALLCSQFPMWKCMQIYVLIYFLILLDSIFYFFIYCQSSALSKYFYGHIHCHTLSYY